MKAFLRFCCCCCYDDEGAQDTDKKVLLAQDTPIQSPCLSAADAKNDSEFYSVCRIPCTFEQVGAKDDLRKSMGDLSGGGESVPYPFDGTWSSSLDITLEDTNELKVPSPSKTRVPWHGAIQALKTKKKPKGPHRFLTPELALSTPNLMCPAQEPPFPLGRAAEDRQAQRQSSSSCLPSRLCVESCEVSENLQNAQWMRSQSLEDMDAKRQELSTPLADEVFLSKEDDTDSLAKTYGIDRSTYTSTPTLEIQLPKSPRHSPEKIAIEEDFQDPSFGSITFTALYNQKKRKLCVEVHKVDNLPPKGKNNIYDVVVRLSVLPSDKHMKTTQILRGSLSPMVQEDFSFSVKEPTGKVLRLSVFNAYLQGKNDAVGHALLNVEDVMSGRPCRYNMQLTKQSQLGPSAGCLRITLRALDVEERMAVEVDETRNLCFTHIARGSRPADKFSTYVKVTLYCSGEKVKSKKSPVVVGDCSPRFDFRTSFKVVPNYLDDCYVVVSVVLKGLLRKDTTLGRYVLGPQFFSQGQQLTPWGRAVLSREDVTHWFHLYL